MSSACAYVSYSVARPCMFLVNLTGCADFSAAFLPWLLEGVHVLRNFTAISRVVWGSGGEENVFVLCKVHLASWVYATVCWRYREIIHCVFVEVWRYGQPGRGDSLWNAGHFGGGYRSLWDCEKPTGKTHSCKAVLQPSATFYSYINFPLPRWV